MAGINELAGLSPTPHLPTGIYSSNLSLIGSILCPVSQEAPVMPSVPADVSELVPRLCHLVRAETGYGFNLHSEKSRPGQYIRSLDPSSPADRAGLRPQDRLIEVRKKKMTMMNNVCLLTITQDFFFEIQTNNTIQGTINANCL